MQVSATLQNFTVDTIEILKFYLMCNVSRNAAGNLNSRQNTTNPNISHKSGSAGWIFVQMSYLYLWLTWVLVDSEFCLFCLYLILYTSLWNNIEHWSPTKTSPNISPKTFPIFDGAFAPSFVWCRRPLVYQSVYGIFVTHYNLTL